MINRKAIEWFKNRIAVMPESETKEMFCMAVAAFEKQEQTKEVIPHRNYQYLSDYWCECGWHLGKYNAVKFCADCGRKINWEKRKYYWRAKG